MSRLTDDQIMQAMLSESAQPQQGSRLDQVAEMVAQMERNLTDKIDKANKQLVEQMQTNTPAPMQENEPDNNENTEVISNENNGGSDEQSKE